MDSPLGYNFPHPLPSEFNVCILGYTKEVVYAFFTFVANKMAVLLSFTVIYRGRHIQLLKQQPTSKVINTILAGQALYRVIDALRDAQIMCA